MKSPHRQPLGSRRNRTLYRDHNIGAAAVSGFVETRMESLGGTSSRPGARALFANLILERSLVDAVNGGFRFIKFDADYTAPDRTQDCWNRSMSTAQIRTIVERIAVSGIHSACGSKAMTRFSYQ